MLLNIASNTSSPWYGLLPTKGFSSYRHEPASPRLSSLSLNRPPASA